MPSPYRSTVLEAGMDLWHEVKIALGAVAVLAVAAQLSVSLPGAAVPVSLQTLALSVLALTLTPKRATGAVVLYIVLAAAGLPLLAEGRSGLAALTGTSGGYVLGFVLTPTVVAGVHAQKSWQHQFLGLLAAHAVILGLGAAWVAVLKSPGLSALLAGAVWPFVPGAVLKSAAGVAVVAIGERVARR